MSTPVRWSDMVEEEEEELALAQPVAVKTPAQKAVEIMAANKAAAEQEERLKAAEEQRANDNKWESLKADARQRVQQQQQRFSRSKATSRSQAVPFGSRWSTSHAERDYSRSTEFSILSKKNTWRPGFGKPSDLPSNLPSSLPSTKQNDSKITGVDTVAFGPKTTPLTQYTSAHGRQASTSPEAKTQGSAMQKKEAHRQPTSTPQKEEFSALENSSTGIDKGTNSVPPQNVSTSSWGNHAHFKTETPTVESPPKKQLAVLGKKNLTPSHAASIKQPILQDVKKKIPLQHKNSNKLAKQAESGLKAAQKKFNSIKVNKPAGAPLVEHSSEPFDDQLQTATTNAANWAGFNLNSWQPWSADCDRRGTTETRCRAWKKGAYTEPSEGEDDDDQVIGRFPRKPLSD